MQAPYKKKEISSSEMTKGSSSTPQQITEKNQVFEVNILNTLSLSKEGRERYGIMETEGYFSLL